MADFLTDYSGIAAAGEGFKSFAQAYQDAQDRQVKKQESQAKINAMNAQMDRDAQDQALKTHRDGFKQGPGGPTDLQPDQLNPKEQMDNQLKVFGEGGKIQKDAEGNTSVVMDPNTPKAMAAKGMQAQRQTSNGFREESLDVRKDTIDRREHERVLTRINANPNIKTRLQQYQNLDNTLSNIANADHVTPEMFDEAQQAVRANLGIKGSSGVGERENTQMKSMGLNAERISEFLSFSPADIGKDNKFLGHIKNLAELEKKNISGQFAKSLEAASAGHKSMYTRRPDLMDDLKDAISAQSGQLDSAPQQSAPPQGLVQPQRGFLGKVGGMLGFGQPAQASAPAAAPHPQDAAAMQWIQQNQNNPDPKIQERVKIIKQQNGVK